MIFKKWEGLVYHESLRDLIMEESLLVEISPVESLNSGEKLAGGDNICEIKALITEESRGGSLSPALEPDRKTFEASGLYYPDQAGLILEYKDKSATIKADFLVETMKIVGSYTFKDKADREISMVIVLTPC